MTLEHLLNIFFSHCKFTMSDPDDYSTIVWDENNINPLPEEDYLRGWIDMTYQYYSEHRQKEYPSIEEQLDKIFHEGIDAWKADIQSVKDKFPKAE